MTNRPTLREWTALQWKHSHRKQLLIVLLILTRTVLGFAQTTSPVTILQQSLAAHVGPAGLLPSDLVIQGQVTDASGTRPLRMQIKGKDRIRYELGLTPRMTVAIYNAGAAWAGSPPNLTLLPAHTAKHRPMEMPFLDVIADYNSSQFKARYVGQELLGSARVLHVAMRLSDPTPQQRFLNRPLHEDVELLIDASTNLILRSQRLQAADNSMDFRVPWILDFSDFRQVSGFVVPFRIVSTLGTSYSGIRQSVLIIQSVLVNQGIADSVFLPQ